MKTRTWFCLLVLGALLLLGMFPAPVRAQPVVYVDWEATGANDGTSWMGAFTDLQAGLAAALAGDEVWVAAGTYYPSVEHGGSGPRYQSFQMLNGVAIYGGFDPTVGDTGWEDRDWLANETILSGDIGTPADTSDNCYHVVTGSGTDSTAILDGFTIRGGYASGTSSPDDLGGGMYNASGSPTVRNVTFSDNYAGFGGGGMYNGGSSPTLTNVTFSDNTTDERGGGMYNSDSSSPTLIGCEFSGNGTGWAGGGMLNVNSSPVLTGTHFFTNTADGHGGGMTNMPHSNPSLVHCAFSGNLAYGVGAGGMYNSYSNPTLTNVTFSGNAALAPAANGGGMYNASSNPMLTNCTFSGNSATSGGGGMENFHSSSPALTNCILWGDSLEEIHNNEPECSPVITYCDIQGGYPGTGNINVDPLFVDAANGDLHLQVTSPAIDAGDNAAVPGGITTDLGGDPRFSDVIAVGDTGAGTPPIVDMGAYEVQEALPPPSIIYVDADATGANNGLSWADAFTDLQDALTWAVDGVEIWVAEGTYLPTSGLGRTASFELINGVGVYGGFDPTDGDVGWDDRDWEANPTLLSGYVGNPVSSADNSYHVLTANGVDGTAVLDGFTISGGNADGTNPHERGGGLLSINSSPTLVNCRFVTNHAAYAGGGIHNSNSSPALSHVTFSDNSADSAGGGMHCDFGSSPSLADSTFEGNTSYTGGGMHVAGAGEPTLTNVVFSGNSSSANGGGLTSYNSSPVLAGVTFTANAAGSGGGGGIFGWGSGNLDLTDVTFSGNYAHSNGNGGALDLSVPTFSLTDVTFKGNYTVGSGRGGAMVMFGGIGTMTRVSFKGNYTGPGSGGGAVFMDSGNLTATDCRFEGNSSDAGGALYNDATTVYLFDSSLVDNSASADGGAIWNDNTGSMQLQGCTLAGNQAVTGDGSGAYNTGELTLVNSTVSGNIAHGNGGGILTMQTGGPVAATRLYNVTVTGNVADETGTGAGDGGGLTYDGSAPVIFNSIIAGNLDNTSSGSQAPDCTVIGSPVGGTVAYSLLGDNRGCEAYFGGVDGNIVGTFPDIVDPLLGQLGDNGGPTLTHALQGDSPARDAGNPFGCTDHNGGTITADQRGMERPRDGGAGLICDMGAFEAGLANDAWNRALELDLSSGSAPIQQYVDQLGQSRWFKFQVAPGSRITAEMIPPDANLDIALFGDIQAAYDELLAPSGESDLVQLNAEFAADAFSPFAYSPFAYSPFAYSPFAYSPFAYSPFAYSPFAYSPFAYSPFAYSPFAYSPFAYSPFAYSPFAYSPFAYSPFAYSPFAYNPFAYSPDPAYSSAQMQALMAISALDGAAAELIEVNTWDNRGSFYLRVSGRNGAFDLSEPFTLQVTQDLGICQGVDLVTRPSLPSVPDGDYEVLFLTDWDRFDQADPTELVALEDALAEFALGYGGTVVDVGLDTYVQAANAVADAAPQCPYAKNQVAWLIKDIVTAYREAGHPLEYVVLVGNDDVIPFFRYPDRAEIGSETDYKPPVLEGTPSYASLTLGYFLSQDAYGSTVNLALSSSSLPIPDLAVGRLVETPADIIHMLDTYAVHGGSLTPASALVVGYDFLEDAANAIRAELEAGLGGTADALITPDEISPQDRDGTPPVEAPWPAEMLRDLLLGSRHDLIFLAGHFTAQGALAADYETRLWASELLGPTVDLENALVYSAGCHSGYNVVNQHGVPYVTVEPDWAQAFAQAGATFIGGTGYQYGDTDFLEYSERLYLEFTCALRCSAQPQSIGQALVAAKQDYLAGTAQMRGIHEKALLEATLFGLPMLQVNGLSDVGCPEDPPTEVTSTESYVSGPGAAPTPGEVLGLRYADLTVTSSLTQQTVSLRNVISPGTYLDVSYFSGSGGTVTSPAEPVLPLERRNVDVPGYVLRGVGFRGGRYVDLAGIIPLTGAASTETRSAHTPFESDVPYPLQQWSVNYFQQLADPSSGITWLNVTPAQFVSDADGDLWAGTWRSFEDMEFRLFYSNHTEVLDEGAVPALAAAPAVLQVLATSGEDQVEFQIRVAGDLAAGIQEVWVTYTGLLCEGDVPCWQSLDLAQSADDSTLWEGTLALEGTPSGVIRYVVQAANGVGLVTLVTNEGAYFQIDVDPADPAEPAGGGEPPSPPEGTTVAFQSPPSSGTYSTEAEFSAVLLRTSDGVPMEGRLLTFALGAQQRSALTDADGTAVVAFPLHGAPGDYSVSVTFAGSTGYERCSATSPFTVLKQETMLTFLQDPGVAQYSDDALMVAELTDSDGRALGEMALLFLISGGGNSYAVSEITNSLGQASPSRVPLPLGTYSVEAYFGQAVTVNSVVVDLTDSNYNDASDSGTLVVGPEDATVTYTGETTVPEGSTTLNLAAVVTQANDGAPGDLTEAWVLYELRDEYGNPVADPVVAEVASDGTSVATQGALAPGATYQVGVTVLGGYFASSPAPQVAGTVDLPLEPVEVLTLISGSAHFIDPDSPLGHRAVWDWGDGSICDTDVSGECALTEPVGTTPGEVNGSHTYTEPGVYTVVLTVTDGDALVAEAIYEFVVIYDLEGGEGFVTGGGWIWSEAGWCQLDELCGSAEGKANFGFVSRYKKGAKTPTGTTEFNFSAGGLNFHSESYQWLAVNRAGTNAQFKGSGTINGEGSPGGELYNFMIWARDGDPDDVDTFRIKIWWEDGGSETTVYDNGFDQAIGGGSIVVHQTE